MLLEGLLPFWNAANVLILDLKGDDPALLKTGFKVTKFPSRMERYSLEHRHNRRPPWYRLFVPGLLAGVPLATQQATVKRAMMQAHRESRKQVKKQLAGWVVVADETMALVDLKLTEYLRDIWQRGRTRRMTFIALTQEPAGVPRSFYRQPQHLYIGHVADEDDQKRLGEIAGDYKLIKSVVKGLGDHEFLFTTRNGRHSYIVDVRKGR